MPVDISERLSEIIPILSFLRVAEEWHTKPGHRTGLFCTPTVILDNRRQLVKRDWKIALSILERVEQEAGLEGVSESKLLTVCSGRYTVYNQYNLNLLERGGFLERRCVEGKTDALIEMTWKGHNLLDEMRDV